MTFFIHCVLVIGIWMAHTTIQQSPNTSNCRYNINELLLTQGYQYLQNLNQQNEELLGDFVEIKKTCPTGHTEETKFERLMVIFISINSLLIEASVDLSTVKIEDSYFVIGSDTINIDVEFPDFPNTFEEATAVLLLKLESDEEIQLLSTGSTNFYQQPKLIDYKVISCLKKRVIDGLLFGYEVSDESLLLKEIFSSWSEFASKILKPQYDESGEVLQKRQAGAFLNKPFTLRHFIGQYQPLEL